MDVTIEEASGEELYDLDLSFLDDLPDVTLGEEPSMLTSTDIDLDQYYQQSQTEEPSWAQHLDSTITEPDYTRFENWIPEFQRPEKPCDYCRSKHLDCYYRKGQIDCHPCKSLFRECSLGSTTMEATNYACNARGTHFDALHSVTEDACIEQGSRTTVKFLKSKGNSIDQSQSEDTSRRNGIRFPQAAVKVLRDWYQTHQDHPYPGEEQKVMLESVTGLKPHQIANWLANQRRKSKIMTKSRSRRGTSPAVSPRPLTPAIDIVTCDKPWEEQDPLERWQHSPPENEPAAFDDIAIAIATSDLPDGASTPSSFETRRVKDSSNGSGKSGYRAASTTSAETSQASSLSAASSAAHSNNSSRGSFGSFGSSLAGKRDRRRKRRTMPLRQSTDDRKRTFQCTFCTDTFKSKYDWTRHEKSLHISLEKYICAPIGPYIIDTTSGDRVCVYCGLHNPEDRHEEKHNHQACEEKGIDSRTFFRKDHLRQHLRLMHGCELLPNMEAWKFTTSNVNSRCGFCAQRFASWQDRVDHLTSHFRAGTRMMEWKGCRGLDPAIAAQVTNAMPPYLIGIESLSPMPFSATNEASMREFEETLPDASRADHDDKLPRSPDDLPPKATCWEILTIRLGQFANEMIAKGTVLTDEMLQSQARHILYGSDDTWNQTAADNPEWLDLFKKGHGLDLIPSKIGGQGQKIPEDLEWYSDLGVRIPFFVQLEQYNKARNEEALENGTGGRARKAAETSVMMRDLYQQLTNDGLLHSAQVQCPHQDCEVNTLECHFIDNDQEVRRLQNRWCNQAVNPANAGSLAKFIGLARSGVQIAPPSKEASVRNAAKARAACLEHLQRGEVSCCPFIEQISVLGDRRDAFLARQAEHARNCQAKANEKCADGTSYFPRHKAELTPSRARNFATVTGPWEDSGMMPQPYSTAETTTGAMVEFLGPNLSMDLPFSTDATTSDIYPSVDDFRMLDVGDHVLSTGLDQPVSTHEGSNASNMCGQMGTTRMLNDSFDMNFDSIFEMNSEDR